MAKSETKWQSDVPMLALLALSAVVATAAIVIFRPPSAENRSIDETLGEELKQEPAARLKGNDRNAAAPRILRGHSRLVAVVVASADGAQLLSADIGDLICTWDRLAGTPLTKIEPLGLGLRRAIFSNSSRYILACDNDNAVRMWKANSGQAVREFRGHTDLVSALDCVPGGDQFVSSSFDASLILWDMQTGKLIRQFGKASNAIVEAARAQTGPEQLNGHSTWIRAVVALPDGKRAVSAGNDRELFFWELDTGTFVSRLVGHSAAVIALTLSPNGQFVASLGADNEILVWDVEKQSLLRRSKHPSKEFPALAISPDSRLLALGDDAGIVRFVDLESGEERSKIETGGVGVTSLAFTPELEGTEIVAGCADGTIRIWPLRDIPGGM